MSGMQAILQSLQVFAQQERAQKSQLYLKAIPGGYGFPDHFWGVTNPEIRKVAKQYRDCEWGILQQLWSHESHEVRLLAVIIMNEQGRKNPHKREIFYQWYRANSQAINNWDLVDTIGPHLVGPYLYSTNKSTDVWQLATSKNLFEQRMAVISQFAWLKAGEDELLYQLGRHFLSHPHDLMHKAVGWLLREAGKDNQQKLCTFLDEVADQMPRTMLRYAIEHFEEPTRKRYLAIKKRK